MPSVEDNKRAWDGTYSWAQRGDEWSSAWGGAAMQWYGTLLPRIHRFLPAGRVLEIACGHGRWTQFLKDRCSALVAVDLSRECVDACRERFSAWPHLEFHLTDGRSLDIVDDHSVDFVFSFDSLVHADTAVLDAYLAQLPRILTHDGAAFLHHSNLGEYQARYRRVRSVPLLEPVLRRLGVLDRNLHWRDPEVSAARVAEMALRHGLSTISQEIVPWGTKRAYIDCFSTLVLPGSALARSNRVFRNAAFAREAGQLAALAQLYAG